MVRIRRFNYRPNKRALAVKNRYKMLKQRKELEQNSSKTNEEVVLPIHINIKSEIEEVPNDIKQELPDLNIMIKNEIEDTDFLLPTTSYCSPLIKENENKCKTEQQTNFSEMDDCSLFADFICNSLKTLSKDIRNDAKREIQDVLYKYKKKTNNQ